MNDLDDLLEDIPDTKATKKQVSKNIIPSKTKPKIQDEDDWGDILDQPSGDIGQKKALGISSSYGSVSGFGKKEAGLNIPPSILNDNSKSMADISRKIQPSFGQGYGASS